MADNKDKTPAPEIQPLGEETVAPTNDQPLGDPAIEVTTEPVVDAFVFDPMGFITSYPLVVPIALIALWVGAIFGWKKLTLMYNMKGQPLAPLSQSLKSAFTIMFKEDKNPLFVKNEELAAKTVWLTWTFYWKVLTLLTLFTFTAGGYLPFGVGNWLLGVVLIAWLGGVGHVKKIFAYRHRILMQMFEVASSEMRYPRGAELNPWGYVQVSGWREMYFPQTTAVMFPAKYRSEDPRNRQAFEINFNGTVSDQNAWSYTWESSNNRVICEPVPFIPKMAPYPFPDRNAWNIFPLGLKSGGEEAVWNVSVYPHCLVAGTTGSGKSVTQGTILLHALQSPDWRVVLIDPKRVELSIYRDHPNVLRVATELEDSVDLIQQVEQEMMSRFSRMEAGGVKHFRSLPDPPPAILLMVDETFALLSPSGIKSEEGKQQDEIKARIGILIGSIARLGRAAGVHQVLATQRPDAKVLPGEVKANLDARIAQGRMDNIPSLMTLDSDAATRLPSVKGRAILRAGNDQSEFQAYFLAEEHLPQVLEMTAAMAQGDTSFLEDAEEEVIEQDFGPKFSMPKMSLPKFSMPSASKFSAWFEKRKALMEENERRAGRGEGTDNPGRESKKSKDPVVPTKVDKSNVSGGMSDARSDVDFTAIQAELSRRPQTLDFGNGLFTGEQKPPTQRTTFTDSNSAATLDFPDFGSDSDDEDIDDMFLDGYEGFSEEEAGYVDHLEDVEIEPAVVNDMDTFSDILIQEVPTQTAVAPNAYVPAPVVSPPPLLPPASMTTPTRTAPLAPGLSVQDVVRKAAERGVPIPASELLSALRAEAARQQAAPVSPSSSVSNSVPAMPAPMERPLPAASPSVRSTPVPKIPNTPGVPTIPAPPVLPNRVIPSSQPVPTRLGTPPPPPAPKQASGVAEAPWMPQELPEGPSASQSPFAPQKGAGGASEDKPKPPMPPAPSTGPIRPASE